VRDGKKGGRVHVEMGGAGPSYTVDVDGGRRESGVQSAAQRALPEVVAPRPM
jgi:hypothetical protein